jgi:hypothetical protein
LIAIVLRQWFVTVLFLKFTTHCTSLRLVSATVLLPILWLILMVLALGVFPLLCGFVKLLIVGAG